MKHFTLTVLLSASFANAVPQPGDTVADQSFSLSPTSSGNTLMNLSDTSLSDFEGKVVVLVYFTPW